MKFHHRLLTLLILSCSMIANVQAMDETRLGTHAGGAIPKLIVASKGDFPTLVAQLKTTGIPELDALWNSRVEIVRGVSWPKNQDMIDASCMADGQNECRMISKFSGDHGDRPVVLMPGFTGYRKMYLEQIHDLLEAGYGPIYISDFAGTGDSFKEELQAGQREPTVAEFDAKLPQVALNVGYALDKKIKSIVGAAQLPVTKQVITRLPIGIGYIRDFKTYNKDVDLIMNQAVRDNPNSRILVTALSMSGLSLVLAMIDQGTNPTWITHVDRVVLESPMIRVKATGLEAVSASVALTGEKLIGSTEVVGAEKSIPEFVDKALGHYNPANLISHSKYRLTLTDSLRVWNGHETTGATLGWVFTELNHQYSTGAFDNGTDRLNDHEDALRNVLARNHIVLIDVSSEADGVGDTHATKMFLNDIKGQSEIHLCLFQTSRHVIDQESERYRQPYMTLLLDQLNPAKSIVRGIYGTAPQNEPLHCQTLQ